MDAYMFYQIIIYILSIFLLLVLIFLGVKAIITLNKVDKVVDDISEKSKKLDNAFGVMDKMTDAFSSINDKLIGITISAITNVFKKIKKKKENDDNE